MTTKNTMSKATNVKSENSKGLAQAKMLNSASMMSAVTSEAFSKSMFPDLDLSELIGELRVKVEKVQSGDLTGMEAMLVGQAHSLQTIFVSLARRASSQEYIKNYGMFMSLALKAQSQSRATIQALTELKYPKQVAFVKQANISHGHQQVNNAYDNHAHAKKNSNQPNELLEVNNGSKTMDITAAKTASGTNPAMATVATKHRRTNNSR